ncbi:hypothetical protein [Candidatus Binatus sp.]|uniref:hypothetical protein n=1 Tax=Candidatus Binatus sp. TaxID=2811406 RepID=UPI003C715BDB
MEAQQQFRSQDHGCSSWRGPRDDRLGQRNNAEQDRVAKQEAIQELSADSNCHSRSRNDFGAARSYVFSSLERQWKRLEENEHLTDKERGDVWLSFINAAHSARQVIRMLFDAVGGSAIYSKKNPFDRWLRDAETWCQHTVVQRKLLETIGGMLLKSDDQQPFPLL